MNSFSRAGADAEGWNEVEEDFTHKIANGLCVFWQDNPDAAVWWAHTNRLDDKEEIVDETEENEILDQLIAVSNKEGKKAHK